MLIIHIYADSESERKLAETLAKKTVLTAKAQKRGIRAEYLDRKDVSLDRLHALRASGLNVAVMVGVKV